MTIEAGQSDATFEVVPHPDQLTEPAETVVVYLKADAAYLSGAKEAVVSIVDGGPVDLDIDSDNDNASAAGRELLRKNRLGTVSGGSNRRAV